MAAPLWGIAWPGQPAPAWVPASGQPSPANLAAHVNQYSPAEIEKLFRARPMSTRFRAEVTCPASCLNHALDAGRSDVHTAPSFSPLQMALLAMMSLGPTADLTNVLHWIRANFVFFDTALLAELRTQQALGGHVDLSRNPVILMGGAVKEALKKELESLDGLIVPTGYLTQINQDKKDEEGTEEFSPPDTNCLGFKGPVNFVYSLLKGAEDVYLKNFYMIPDPDATRASTSPSSGKACFDLLPDELVRKIFSFIGVVGTIQVSGRLRPVSPQDLARTRMQRLQTARWDYGWIFLNNDLPFHEFTHKQKDRLQFESAKKMPLHCVPRRHQQLSPGEGLARLDRRPFEMKDLFLPRSVCKRFDRIGAEVVYSMDHWEVLDTYVHQVGSARHCHSDPISDRFLRQLKKWDKLRLLRSIGLSCFNTSFCEMALIHSLVLLRWPETLNRLVLLVDHMSFGGNVPGLQYVTIPGLEFLSKWHYLTPDAKENFKVYIPANRAAQRWVQDSIDKNLRVSKESAELVKAGIEQAAKQMEAAIEQAAHQAAAREALLSTLMFSWWPSIIAGRSSTKYLAIGLAHCYSVIVGAILLQPSVARGYTFFKDFIVLEGYLISVATILGAVILFLMILWDIGAVQQPAVLGDLNVSSSDQLFLLGRYTTKLGDRITALIDPPPTTDAD